MRATSTAALLLSVVLVLASCFVSAEYTNKDAVVILTDKNFEKEVLNSPDYWLVEFYAPWCGHCKNLEPEYKAAAKKLKKHARLGAVDATVHQALAQKYQIKGYPTIKEFGANKKKPRDYQGGRTRKDIIQYVKNSEEAKKLGVSGVSIDTLAFSTINTFLTQDDSIPTAVFFGSRRKGGGGANKAPSWLGSLAQHFSKQVKKGKKKTVTEFTVRVAFVPATEEKIAKHLRVDSKLPALLFIDGANTKFLAASGKAIADEASAKKFISNALEANEQKREGWDVLPLFPSPEVAKKKPRVQLDGLSKEEFAKCTGKKGKMCVILTKSEENDASGVYKDLAKRYRRDPFRFLVADSNDPVLKTISASLGLSDVSALVIKPGRTVKFTELSGPADEAKLRQLLDRIVDGSTHFQTPKSPLQELFAEPKQEEVAHEEL